LKSYVLFRVKRIGVPILTVGLMLLARRLLEPALHGRLPYSFFLVAVIVTAWTTGIWETLLAMALGLAAGTWFFANPVHSMAISDVDDRLSSLLYLIVGLSIIWFARSEQAARLRALTSAVEVRKREEELERARTAQSQSETMRERLTALEQSQARYRNLFDSAPAGLAELDPATGRFRTVNARLCEITGYSPDELLQKTDLELTHPEDRKPNGSPAPALARLQTSGGQISKRYLRKDGHAVPVHIRAALLRDQQGQPVGAITLIEEAGEGRI
jgi:PAS domain S-box-containing protein